MHAIEKKPKKKKTTGKVCSRRLFKSLEEQQLLGLKNKTRKAFNKTLWGIVQGELLAMQFKYLIVALKLKIHVANKDKKLPDTVSDSTLPPSDQLPLIKQQKKVN